MGIAICGIYQKKDGDKWVSIDPLIAPLPERHYLLYAWLADVCNSFNIKPISIPRGFPADFEYIVDGDGCYTMFNGKRVYLGDIHHSWVTSTEILEAYKTLYNEDDEGILVLGTEVDEKSSRVRVTAKVYAGTALRQFISFIKPLHSYYGEVRFVFGFS